LTKNNNLASGQGKKINKKQNNNPRAVNGRGVLNFHQKISIFESLENFFVKSFQ